MDDGRTPRRQRADARRSIAAILDAATSVLSRQPEATMAEIAKAAGVGRVTLYAHFASRDALLDAAVDRAAGRMMAAFDAAIIDDGPAPEALGRMLRAGWPALDAVWGLLAAGGAQSAAWVRDHRARLSAHFGRLIARGRADGSFRTDLPDDWLVAATIGLVHAVGREVGDGRLDATIAADVVFATILAILTSGVAEGSSTVG
jgi:AcrR family transcriptional regulator